jgi:general secretion pathway protein J
MAILGLVALLVFGALRLGIRAWERGERDVEAHQQLRSGLGLLVQQVRSAFPYRLTAGPQESGGSLSAGTAGTQGSEMGFLFEGTPTSLLFVTTMPLHRRTVGGLGVVTYVAETRPSGEMTLTLQEQRAFTGVQRPAVSASQAVTVLEGFADLRFAYFASSLTGGTGEWVEAWDGRKEGRLPEAVRVTVRYPEAFRAAAMTEEGWILPIQARPKTEGITLGLARPPGKDSGRKTPR